MFLGNVSRLRGMDMGQSSSSQRKLNTGVKLFNLVEGCEQNAARFFLIRFVRLVLQSKKTVLMFRRDKYSHWADRSINVFCSEGSF